MSIGDLPVGNGSQVIAVSEFSQDVPDPGIQLEPHPRRGSIGFRQKQRELGKFLGCKSPRKTRCTASYDFPENADCVKLRMMFIPGAALLLENSIIEIFDVTGTQQYPLIGK